MRIIFLFIGVATITIIGDEGASGVVGIAHSSQHVLIGEPSGGYNGTALIWWVHISFFQRKLWDPHIWQFIITFYHNSIISTILKTRWLVLKKGRIYYVCILSVLMERSKYSSLFSSYLQHWCTKGKRILIKRKG